MRIPKDVILLWPGLNSAIPSGFTRETALDGLYPKAWGTEDPADTGGNATHTHTSPSHNHTVNNHNHTYTVPQCPSRDTAHTHVGGTLALLQHTHLGTTGNIVTNNAFGSTAATYGAVANDPPFHGLIFIKAGDSAVLQDSMIGLWAGFNAVVTVPTNWQFCNGSGGSPDLRNKYIKGSATSANAGVTGGSLSNVHDLTHGHTGASHNHDASTTGTGTGGTIANGSGDCCSILLGHTHSYSATQATTVTPDNFTSTLATPETVEPVYKKVCAIQKKAGGSKPKGLIGLWLGDVDEIPKGWVLCDGTNGTPDLRDKYIKIANDTTEIGNTGGSNTHTHAAQSHSHTIPSHVHAMAQTKNHVGITDKNVNEVNPGNADDTNTDDTHPTFNTDGQTATTTSANTTADESDNEPEYKVAAYIMYQKEVYGGAAILGASLVT